jgi:hypothetical protein
MLLIQAALSATEKVFLSLDFRPVQAVVGGWQNLLRYDNQRVEIAKGNGLFPVSSGCTQALISN